MPSPDGRERYLAEARKALREATLDDLLGFISVRQIAGGMGTSAFYQAFPGGRKELLECLKREAAPERVGISTPITVGTVTRAMELINRLKDGETEAVKELREVALVNFDQILGLENEDANHVLRALMGAVAGADENSREDLRGFYDALAEEYAGVFGAILVALEREPIEGIDSVIDLTMAITAMVGGLSFRARLGQSGKAVLAGVLLPMLAALTVPKGKPYVDPVDSLFD